MTLNGTRTRHEPYLTHQSLSPTEPFDFRYTDCMPFRKHNGSGIVYRRIRGQRRCPPHRSAPASKASSEFLAKPLRKYAKPFKWYLAAVVSCRSHFPRSTAVLGTQVNSYPFLGHVQLLQIVNASPPQACSLHIPIDNRGVKMPVPATTAWRWTRPLGPA